MFWFYSFFFSFFFFMEICVNFLQRDSPTNSDVLLITDWSNGTIISIFKNWFELVVNGPSAVLNFRFRFLRVLRVYNSNKKSVFCFKFSKNSGRQIKNVGKPLSSRLRDELFKSVFRILIASLDRSVRVGNEKRV